MVEIRLYPEGCGRVAWVDDEDAPLARLKWWAVAHPKRGPDCFYAMRAVVQDGKKTTMYLHREIMQAPPDLDVDHRDGNGLDCRRDNLRLATRQSNLMNRGRNKNNRSGFKGVVRSHAKGKPWRAMIKVDRKVQHLGYFATAEDAARAYDARARELYPDFAFTNFHHGE